MASSNRVSWEKDIRDSIRTNFGAGWRVNGENSGKTINTTMFMIFHKLNSAKTSAKRLK